MAIVNVTGLYFSHYPLGDGAFGLTTELTPEQESVIDVGMACKAAAARQSNVGELLADDVDDYLRTWKAVRMGERDLCVQIDECDLPDKNTRWYHKGVLVWPRGNDLKSKPAAACLVTLEMTADRELAAAVERAQETGEPVHPSDVIEALKWRGSLGDTSAIRIRTGKWDYEYCPDRAVPLYRYHDGRDDREERGFMAHAGDDLGIPTEELATLPYSAQ